MRVGLAENRVLRQMSQVECYKLKAQTEFHRQVALRRPDSTSTEHLLKIATTHLERKYPQAVWAGITHEQGWKVNRPASTPLRLLPLGPDRIGGAIRPIDFPPALCIEQPSVTSPQRWL